MRDNEAFQMSQRRFKLHVGNRQLMGIDTQKGEWPVSARYMNASFSLWASGLCFLYLVAFYMIRDKLGWAIPTFTAVGMNSLLVYFVHLVVLDVEDRFPLDSMASAVGIAGFACSYAVFVLGAGFLGRRGILIKI